MKHTIQLTALAAALALAGCGGGGGFYGPATTTTTSSTTTTGTTTTGTTTSTAVTAPSSIAVSQSKPSLSTGGDSLTLTFRVLDANGGVILGAPVSVAITNPTQAGVYLSTVSQLTTDAVTGLVTTTLNLGSGNLDYRINHNIVLTVTSTQAGKTVTQTLTIPATGTKLTMASSTTTPSTGNNANISVTAVDGGGQPMSGASVNLINSSSGAVVATASTSSNGIATFAIPASTVSAASGGQLNLTAVLTGSIATITQNSSNTITLIAPSTNQVLSFLPTTATSTTINTNATIAVQVQAASQADLTGQSVSFATSEGTLANTSVPITNITQNSSGVWVGTATTTLNSTSAGTATLLVTFGSTSISGVLQVISTIPSAMTLQSTVSVLAPAGNTPVIAVVKDANGAPVSNATVNFSITNDPSGGSLSSPQATTDASGQASVTYTAGATATSVNAVKINATATNGTVTVSSAPLTLTVAQQAAFITVSLNNVLVLNASYPTYYFQDLSDSVVDIAGNPITNQQVSIVLAPQKFSKGFWWYGYPTNNGFPSTGSPKGDPVGTIQLLPDGSLPPKQWNQAVTTTCDSTQFQNIPNPAALITSTSSTAAASATYTTDSTGAFNYQMRYGKNYSTWLVVGMNATTVVGTNQSTSSLSIPLWYLATDLDQTGQISPPFISSPYGQDTSCSDLN